MKYTSLFPKLTVIAVCMAFLSGIVQAQYYAPVQGPVGEPADGQNTQPAAVVAADDCMSYQMAPNIVRDRADGWYKTVCPMSCDQFWGPGQWRFKAWLDQGITYGSKRQQETFAPQVYNDMYNTYQMNQVYLALERKVAEDCMSFSWGGRVDLFFGTDYYYTQAYGLEASNIGYMTTVTRPEGRINHWNGDGKRFLAQDVSEYGFSIPQAYVEMYMPVMTGVKIKAGHYYSGMSIESPMAVENFFYSHSYTSYYGTPTTLTGVDVSIGGSTGFSIFGGFDLGWNRVSTKDGGASGYGGFRWKDACNTFATQFMVHSGQESWTYVPNRFTPARNANFNVTVLSWLSEWRLNSWLATSLEFVYGWDNKGDFPRKNFSSSSWTGITNSWYVRCTDTITTGLRFEWFQDNPQCGRIVYSQIFNDSTYNVYDISLGVNWKPTYWCTVRPEVRWDWSDLNGPIKFFNEKNSQFTFGMDLLLNF